MSQPARLRSVLFNDVGRAPREGFIRLSDRMAIADYLWEQGWRRDIRPEDVNADDADDHHVCAPDRWPVGLDDAWWTCDCGRKFEPVEYRPGVLGWQSDRRRVMP